MRYIAPYVGYHLGNCTAKYRAHTEHHCGAENLSLEVAVAYFSVDYASGVLHLTTHARVPG